MVARKNDIQLNTPTGGVIGERSLNVELGEQTTVENTKEIYPGLFVSGMAANGVSGSFRMGPIFGGMLMSGKKAAELICEKLGNWELNIENWKLLIVVSLIFNSQFPMVFPCLKNKNPVMINAVDNPV